MGFKSFCFHTFFNFKNNLIGSYTNNDNNKVNYSLLSTADSTH